MSKGRTIVLRLTPKLRLAAICTIVFLLGIFWLSAYVGYLIGIGDAVTAKAQNVEMSDELISLRESQRKAQQRAVRAEKSAEIDRLAAEDVRQALLAYRNEVADLESDVEFYRRLMAPDELDKGLSLYAFKLSFDNQTQRYQYSALVTQAGGKNQVIKGNLAITLLAQQGSSVSADLAVTDNEDNAADSDKLVTDTVKLQSMSLADLPDYAGSLPAKLRFRFFQTIEGSFKLPDDITPVSVVVAVKSTGKSAQQIEKTFNWQDLMGAS